MSFEKFCHDNKIPLKKDESMKNHTSFKIGGTADYFICCENIEQLGLVIKQLNQDKIPYFILGKGSNILVSDKGINGAVISLNCLDKMCVCGDKITAEAGVSLAKLCTFACENSLSGLEFAYGIPASVGGAMYMNAGAYGGELSQAVVSATFMNKDGNIEEVTVDKMQLGYRKSIFKQNGGIILSVTFKFTKCEKDKIKAQMDDYLSRRKEKQPLEYPSAGSIFKRPQGNFAGALIEKNNFKGVSVGGAMVSEKHAGFIINHNNATAEDVINLMEKIKDTVLEKDGVLLEPEVIFIGRE